MGCYPPLGKIVSKALGKCNGRERWREGRLDFDYASAYPPTETHYMQPVARTVTFASNNSIYVIPPSSPPPPQPQPQPQQQQSTPEPQQPQTPPRHEPEQHHDTPESQPPQHQTEQPETPAPQTQGAPPQAEPKPPKGPKRGKKKQPGRVRFGPEPPPPQREEQEQAQAQQEHAQQGPPGNGEKPPGQGPHGAAPTPGYLLRYTPSPLPRWEATPRRHEYFSGEYRSYYPTPVREGIYRIATDANRLTTIFSEENPNACTIV